MPDISPSTALTARDTRHEALSWALNEGRQTTAFLSLNLPGPKKSPPGSATLFAWALQEIADHFPETILHEQGQDVLGHYAILLIDHAPRTVKQVAIALETRHAAARLIDLDVYTTDGSQLGRRELGLPPRRCLLCEQAAVDCIRRQGHDRNALIAKAQALLLEREEEEELQREAIAATPLSVKAASENRQISCALPMYLFSFPFSSQSLRHLAACLTRGARDELALTPKPGLVDQANNGSHPDLSYARMEESIGYVGEYLDAVVTSLIAGEPFECQKQLAIAAEQRLYERLHTNTHKGFIFLSGMLLIACQHAASFEEVAIRRSLSTLAADFFRTAPVQPTHGQRVREKFRTGGIVDETLRGFPALFEEALPAYRTALARHGDEETARFALLACLMQCVEDTTTLHRAGPAGLARIRDDGRQLEKIIAEKGDCRACLEQLDGEYIRQNLTMGGVADMLGMALGYLCFCASSHNADTASGTLGNSCSDRKIFRSLS